MPPKIRTIRSADRCRQSPRLRWADTRSTSPGPSCCSRASVPLPPPLTGSQYRSPAAVDSSAVTRIQQLAWGVANPRI
eukprot:6862043-Prymnesium_polylepis.1